MELGRRGRGLCAEPEGKPVLRERKPRRLRAHWGGATAPGGWPAGTPQQAPEGQRRWRKAPGFAATSGPDGLCDLV